MVNHRKDIVAALISGAMQTLEDGRAAEERALACKPLPGDRRKIEQYLFLAEMLGERAASVTVERTVTT